MKYKAAIALAGCLSVVACSPTTTEVRSFADRDYSAAETYAWYSPPGEIEVDNPEVNRVAVGELIRKGIGEALEKKGLSERPAEKADILIRYFATVVDVSGAEADYRLMGDDPFATRGGGVTDSDPMVAGMEPRRLHEYDEGTLVIEALDAGTSKLIWRGTARSPVDLGAEREATERRLRRTLEKLFRKFPPS
jgi:hypothetical protein